MNNDPLNLIDPTGQVGLPGIIIGAVIGGVSGGATAAANGAGYGGIAKGVLIGGVFGAGVGAINPLASEGAGAFAVALTYGTTGAAAGAVGSLATGGSSSQIQAGAIAGALAPFLSGEALIAGAADAIEAETGLTLDALLSASSATIEAGLNRALKALQPGQISCP